VPRQANPRSHLRGSISPELIQSISKRQNQRATLLLNGRALPFANVAPDLAAGQYMLVKASIAGAIVTNALLMLGASFLLGGLRYHVQEYNRAGGRLYSALLLMATVALLAPSAVADLDLAHGEVLTQKLSTGLAVSSSSWSDRPFRVLR